MNSIDIVWSRIKQCEGALFRTITGLPFQVGVDGNGVWIFRANRAINRRLTKQHFRRAVERCPLQNTTDLRDCLGPSYIFGILMDARIRQGLW